MVGAFKDWPAGRGLFYNQDKTLVVWVGEEDHLRVIAMQKGGDLGAVYARMVKVGGSVGQSVSQSVNV